MELTKTCTKCGVDKPITDFAQGRGYRDGRVTWCRDCYKDYRAKRLADPAVRAHEAEYAHLRYARLKETGEYQRQQKQSRLRCRFGMSMDDYIQMAVAQGNLCAICGRPAVREGKTCCLDVDHDHKTGRVRGLLCKNCNLMIGNAQDDPATLRKGAAYLEQRPPADAGA